MEHRLQPGPPGQQAPTFGINPTDMLGLSKQYAQQRGLPRDITAWTREDIALFLTWWAKLHPRPI